MKHIISSFLVLAALHTQAQDIDRTKAPQPLPAPTINIPDAASFTLPNGLKVFVVTNSKLPQVAATLTIDKLAIAEGSKAGAATMMGTLLRYGTLKLNKEKLDEEIDFLGGEVSSGPLSVSGSSLTGNFPKLFSLMADVALRPAFSAKELEKIRKQTLSGLESNKDEPDVISRNVTNVLLYGKKHPYGEIETEASVKSVTLAHVRKFYTANWKPNAAYLVFVGDITTDQAKKLATQYFGTWVKGVLAKETYPAVKAPTKTYIAIVDRPASVQSVIRIATPVQLAPGAPDAIPSSLMNTILGGGFSSRINQNLREKHAFTYGAGSSLSNDRLVGRFSAGGSVRNEKTDSSIAEFLHELNRMQTELPADTEVTSIKNYMSGGFARSLEEAATVADFALNIARYGLPKDYYRNYLTNLAAVTPAKVGEEAKKFLSAPVIITIVGNAREIAPGLEKYGEVKYFDMYGNPTAAPVVKKIDAAVTGEQILQKAIEAYGGEGALANVKDIELKGKVNIMGQELEYVQRNIFPSGFSTAVKMGGMAVMKQLKNGSTYSVSMQGNEMPMDAAAKEEIDMRAAFFTERYMLANKYTYKLKGIEQVDGKDAYVVAIKSPTGSDITAFYEVATGLKLQEQSEKDGGPMGKLNITTKIGEYKVFEGLKIPVKLIIDLGQFKQDVNIDSVKLNQGLKEADL